MGLSVYVRSGDIAIMTIATRRVYHFLNEEYGIQSIRNRRIKISTFLGVNDPFELLAHEVTNKSLRALMNAQRQEFSKSFGILCFSRSSKSPVQWAHYGDRNRGVCLGFDVDSKFLKDVQYLDARLKGFAIPTDPATTEDWSQKMFFTKYSQWSYEEEARMFASLDESVGGLYFKDFDRQVRLAEVQVGYNSQLTRIDIANALGDLKDSVEVFKVRPAFQSFEMVRDRKASSWK